MNDQPGGAGKRAGVRGGGQACGEAGGQRAGSHAPRLVVSLLYCVLSGDADQQERKASAAGFVWAY